MPPSASALPGRPVPPRRERLLLALAAALVLAVFAASAHSGLLETLEARAPLNYYNQLVEGFRTGHLYLARTVPAGLARLPDPYDPVANHPYRNAPIPAEDLSYYHGRFYLYFGAAPAVLLFWPWVALTGNYLLHRQAACLLCALGFLFSAALLRGLARRYFPAAGPWPLAAGFLAMGIASGLPIMLERSDVYEVAVGCGYALAMLGLCAVWRALEDPARASRWLAAGGLAFGLAVASRPNLLFAAAVLLVPIWVFRKAAPGRLLAAAVLPMVLCGLGIMAYNRARFGSVFDFGQRYQISGIRQDLGHQFGPRYLWFNFRIYFLEPFRWHSRFPFVGIITPPKGPGAPEGPFPPFGVLPNLPFALLALALPAAWRIGGPDRPALRPFLIAALIFFAAPAAVALLFFGSTTRYEMEFLPELMLLAAIGVLAVEASPLRPGWFRPAWTALLAVSVAVSLLASLHRFALERCYIGSTLADMGREPEAITQLRSALKVEPGYADARVDLGVALARSGRLPEAMGEFEEAARLDPNRADVHDNLGNGFVQLGRVQEGIDQYRQAIRIKPDSARTHYNLALALLAVGQRADAREEYQRAVALDPSLAR